MSLKNPYKSGGMFEGVSHIIFENAKKLRDNLTAAEMVLWIQLRKDIESYKFRRQHQIGIYIADFYCHKAKLIIEVDGSIHNKKDVKEADLNRENDLKNWGYKVIRFSNQQIMNQIEYVLECIKKKIIEITTLSK